MPDPTKWSPPSTDEVATEKSWTPPDSDTPAFESSEDAKKKSSTLTSSSSGGSAVQPTSSASVSATPSTSSKAGVAVVTPSGGSTDKFKEHLKKGFVGVSEPGKFFTKESGDAFVNSLQQEGYPKPDVNALKAYKDKLAQSAAYYKELTGALKKNPNDRDANYQLGLVNLDNGDHTAAINYFSKALNSPQTPEQQPTQGFEGNPYPQKVASSDSNALFGIGYATQKSGNDQQAASFYQDALKADPHNAAALKGLASITYKNGDQPQAAQLIDQAKQIDKEKQKLENRAGEYREEKSHENDTRDYLNSIADGLESTFIKGEGPLGWLNPLTSAANAVAGGIEEGVNTLKKVPEVTKTEGLASGGLVLGSGLAKIGLGVLMGTPEGIAFNTGASIANTILPSNLTKMVMSPGSSLLDYLDADPSEGAKAVASFGDILAQALALKGIHGKELSEKFKKDAPLTPEEYKQVQEVIPSITDADLSKATEEVYKHEPSVDKKLAALQKTKEDLLKGFENVKSQEAQKTISDQLTKVNESIAAREKEITDEHTETAQKEADKVQVQNTIEGLNADLENSTGEAKDLIQSRIDELQKELPKEEKQVELIKPKEDAIQIEKSRTLDVQPEARNGERVGEGNAEHKEFTGKSEEKNSKENVPPTSEEKNVAGEAPEGKKLRSIEKRVNESDLPEDIKSQLRDHEWGYIPEKIDVNAENAQKIIDLNDTDQRLETLTDKMLNKSNEITPATRAALAPKLWETYRKKIDAAREEGDMVSYDKYMKKLVEINTFDKNELTTSAQKLAIGGKLWKKTLGKYPETIVAELKSKIKEERDKALEGKENQLKSYKDFVDDFVKSEEFDKIVSEKVKGEIEKLGKKAVKKENIFNSKEFRETRKAELKNKWKDASKGSASSSFIGLNKEQIEVLGEMGAIYVAEGAHNFANWIKKMKKEFEGVTDEQLDYIWRNAKLHPDLDEAQRTLKDFATIGRFEKMSREEKKVLLDKLGQRIKGMTEERKKQFLADVIDEVDKLGGLDEERFKELYAKAMGLPHLDEVAKEQIYDTTKKIANVDKIVDEYQKAYEANESKQNLKEIAKRLDAAKEEARMANDKLSDYFKNEKTLGDIMSAAIQGNLMTLITAQTNVVGNLSKGFITAPASRGLSSGIDFLLSKAAKLPLLSKLIKEGRTQDAIAYWKGAIPAFPRAFVKAAKGSIKGNTAEDYTIRDTHTKIEPIKAWENIISTIKGDKKSSAYQFTKDIIEGTGGMAAEPLFRIMNAGDKLFTHMAEEGTKSEMASLLGYTGKQRERFMAMPPELQLKTISDKAAEYTFQEDSGIAKKALQLKRGLIDLVPENTPQPIKDIWKTLINLQIPFIKTPVNVLNYMVDLAIPEVAIAKSIWHGAIMKDRSASIDSLGRAIVGFGLRSVFSQAAKNNLITPMISDEDSKSAKSFKLGGADVKPGQINMSAFKRMISGGDPAPQPDDTWINYKYFGLFAINMNQSAQAKEYYKDPQNSEIENYGNMILGTMKNLPKNILEQTFLSGLNTLLDAISSPDKFNRYATNNAVAASSMIYPNTIAQISKFSQPEQKDVRVDQGTDWEKFKGTLKNTFKDRMFMGGDLPSKVTIWGEKVSQLPEQADAGYKYMYALFDAYKPNKVNPESFQYKLYKTFDDAPADKKNQLLPSLPKRGTINVNGAKLPINEKQYQDLSIYVGQARKELVEEYILSDDFGEADLGEKIKKLKAIYKKGLAEGKQAFIDANPQVEEVENDEE